jgi:aminomethyltransferase
MSEPTTELKRTPLYQAHRAAGARLVDFSGWEMPLHYGSQKEEHHIVRQRAGLFDVSHMVVSDLTGLDARRYLQQLLANDVERLQQQGKALYSCMLNAEGGVIDDLIVYWLGEKRYRIVTNAATREGDLAWMQQQLEGFEAVLEEQPGLAMVAVQGPEARAAVLNWLSAPSRERVERLERFVAAEVEEGFIARTGYTGEDGFELVLQPEDAVPFWQAMVDAGVTPCGLGARDTLRLEAGMMLYGADMDTTTTPLESALGWTVAFSESRPFNGRAALEQQQSAGVPRKLVGLRLEGKGVMRSHQPLYVGEEQVGEITSGGFSPTLNQTIALARVAAAVSEGCEVEMRGRRLPVKIQRPLFVRNGAAVE